jgi:pilus assembly protein CpaC
LGQLLWIWVVFAVPGLAFGQEGNVINIGVGTQKVLTIPGVEKAAIADTSKAEVKAVGGSLLITGVAEGRTTLIIFKGRQRITYVILVHLKDPAEVMAEIRKMLGDMEGVTVRESGDRIILDGQTYTAQDAERIDQIVSMFPNVKSLVKVNANARVLAAQNLNKAFQRAGLKNAIASVVGNTIFAEGTVESAQDMQKAEVIIKTAGEKIENLLGIGLKKLIQSEVQFVEISRTGSDTLGIKYPFDISGNATASIVASKDLIPAGVFTAGSTYAANASSGFALGFQTNAGYARLLAQPNLVCASGEKASFLAGGQVPIPLITNNQFTVDYKPYGVILNLRPTADKNGNIQTDVEAEVSEVDNSVSVSVGPSASVPGFLTRKVTTSVTVRHGETIVLSGIFQHNEQKSVSKVPGLGSIPIIGELFKYRTLQENKRDLVIFVTPRIVTPDSDNIRTMLEDIKSEYRQAHSQVYFNIFD